MFSKEITVNNQVGLYARPATFFIQKANEYKSTIMVEKEERKVNAKFGVSAFDDTLPKRLTDVPQNPDDPTTKVPLEKLKKTYYRARGWNQNGLPTKATLRKLKIDK